METIVESKTIVKAGLYGFYNSFLLFLMEISWDKGPKQKLFSPTVHILHTKNQKNPRLYIKK